jgi:hypothetical protein
VITISGNYSIKRVFLGDMKLNSHVGNTDRKTDRQTDIQKDRQTDRHTDRQTERQTDIDRKTDDFS